MPAAKVLAFLVALLFPLHALAGANRDRGQDEVGPGPDEVKISCAKPGYRQYRVFRHPSPRGGPVRAVETECRLQKS